LFESLALGVAALAVVQFVSPSAKAVTLSITGAITADRVPRHLQVTGDLLDRLALDEVSRRIRAIVSTTNIPNHLLHSKAGSATDLTVEG
jgi:hypothetical protein